MKEAALKNIGQALRKYRKSKHLTQGQAAERTGIARQTISDIERGEFTGSLSTLQRYMLFANLELSFREKSSGFPQLEELANLYGED